jgi:hypothetical protein
VAPVAPGLKYSAAIDPNGISRDPEEVKNYVEDPLIKDTATLGCRKCLCINKHSPKIQTKKILKSGLV